MFDTAKRALGPALLLLLLVGCGAGDKPEGGGATKPTGDSSSGAGQPSALQPPAVFGKLKFKTGAESTAFSLKPESNGYKLLDGAERELFRYTWKGDKLKIKDDADREVGYITGADGKYKVKTADQQTVLFILQRQEDGDWKLETGDEKLLVKINKREYGWELEDAGEKELYKVKLKDDKASLRDAADETKLYTKDPLENLAALACLGLDALNDAQRFGLFARLNTPAEAK
ncbi:MAG: hypothetical protein M5U26_26095 [Planctomycetota bacterium]|nr:hypothetical protein [Planctomycetota bacterium]